MFKPGNQAAIAFFLVPTQKPGNEVIPLARIVDPSNPDRYPSTRIADPSNPDRYPSTRIADPYNPDRYPLYLYR